MSNESDNGKTGGGEAGADASEKSDAAALEPMTEIEKLEQAKKELHDRLLRTAADFENFKKRAKKESDEAQSRGREALVKEVLPVLDNLERALKHTNAEDPLAKGVSMVEKQLLGVLEKFGVTRFSAVGQPFDPSLHEAIQQVESEMVAPGSVAEEFAKGYMAGGRLLRPAMVAVAKIAAAATPSPSPSGDKA